MGEQDSKTFCARGSASARILKNIAPGSRLYYSDMFLRQCTTLPSRIVKCFPGTRPCARTYAKAENYMATANCSMHTVSVYVIILSAVKGSEHSYFNTQRILKRHRKNHAAS